MLPLNLLNTAQGHPMLVELKNGETYNGHLVNCDTWMNVNLRDVICTSPEGDRFWRMPECYIRGNTVKYMRIPEEVVDLVREYKRPASGTYQPGGRGGGGFKRGRGQSDRGGYRGGRGRGGYRGRGS